MNSSNLNGAERNAPVICKVADAIAHVTLNRPGSVNTIDLDMAQQLMITIDDLDHNPDIRVAILDGAGDTFCAGGDLNAFRSKGDGASRYIKEVTGYFHSAIAILSSLRIPVIAAVQGSVAGAGLGLACACDLLVAGESARFIMAYTQVGLTPDGSSSWSLPRSIGLHRALLLTLTNRELSALEAFEWGLVSEVVADRDLASRTTEIATILASGPTMAYASAKKLMRDSFCRSLENQMSAESEAVVRAAAGPDGQEGITAFVEKRKPDFCGR